MAENKEIFKNYHIGEIIGRGRFAIVYKAEKLDVRKTVALKVLNPEFATRSDIRDQFREQAKQQARLNHPRLVRVEDLREEHGQFFVAMEYMPLGNLRRSLTHNGIPTFRETAVIIEDVAEALDYLHGRSLTHGDVKPENILLVDDPTQKGVVRAKLSDLRLPLVSEISQTVSENFVELTPEYVSPEQADGHPNTPLSDQYSLGVVAFELLCGHPPFTGKSTVDLYIDHQKSSPPSLQNLNNLVTAELEQVVLRALEKSPEKRYPTCGEFARALRTAVVATEQKRLSDQLLKAESLMEKQELDAARAALRDALLIQPDNQRAAQLVTRLEHQEQISRNYQQAVRSLEQAEAKAQEIRKASTDFPDEAGYLKMFAPPPPSYWKQLANRWKPASWLSSSILIVGLIMITCLTTIIENPAGQPIKQAFVEFDRSSTPTLPAPTATFTPTPLPTSTATVTPTLPPSPTPTQAPTPIGGGGKIAFSSKQNEFYQIYVSDISGPVKPLLTQDKLNNEYPVWSPDGKKLAFLAITSGNDYDVFSIDSNGGNRVKITDQAAYYPGIADFHIEHISWSGDSSKIAYAYKYKPSLNGNGNSDRYQIYKKNADDSESPTQLLENSTQYNYYFPAWSPTEDKIAFVTDRHGKDYPTIYVVNADGSDARRLTSPQQKNTSPSWSPDGTQIAFVSSRNESEEIYIMDKNGENQTRLTTTHNNNSPVWSPDGSKIAFLHESKPGTRKWEIFIMNANGSGQMSLVPNLDNNIPLAWSPDSQMIAYVSGQNGSNEIIAINVNTLTISSLTNNDQENIFPSWSR